MDDFLVSVIIPVHDCAKYVGQAIDSALAQEVPLEILVIDDGSRDNLDQVMRRYRSEPRIRYLKNEANLGVAETRNRGVRLAKGNYIAFLDADDYWMHNKLKKQLALMEETGCVICSTARELMTMEGKLTGHIISVKAKITYSDLLLSNRINCSSVVMRTEVAREFPMHHDDSHEDYLMWLEVLRKYRTACAVNEPLLKYRISETGKSGNKWQSAKMTFMVYRYMGFGWIRSILHFCSYAVHGMLKYFGWFLD
ncbi:MAG: glycosyltransferase family 2 protein [Faecousia sp.]